MPLVTTCNNFLKGNSGGVNTKIKLELAKRTTTNAVSTGLTDHTEIESVVHMTAPTGNKLSDAQVKNIGYNGYSQVSYLNIWVVDEIWDGNTATSGYANYPHNPMIPPHGIVIRRDRINTNTLAHELGHYLNLWHTFEGGCTNDNCLTDGDRVCDTPAKSNSGFVGNCNIFPLPQNPILATCDCPGDSCPSDGQGTDQLDNLMDYTLDCRILFTEGQKTRMRECLLNHQNRRTLLDSRGCVPHGIAVDADLAELVSYTADCVSGNVNLVVQVRNNGEQDITSLTIGYSLVGQNIDDDISMSLASPIASNANQNINVSFNASGVAGGSHNLYLTLLSVNNNGSTTVSDADGYAENNELCTKISVDSARPPSPMNLTSTIFPIIIPPNPINIWSHFYMEFHHYQRNTSSI